MKFKHLTNKYEPIKLIKADTLLMISTCLGDDIMIQFFVFFVSIIVYLSTALGLECWICYTNTSWADCEDKLVSKSCPTNIPGLVCQTKFIITTEHGKTETQYSKECGLLSQCDAALCNIEHHGKTERCQLECCCHDNCNTGVLVQGQKNKGVVHSLHGVCKMFTIIIMALYSTMT